MKKVRTGVLGPSDIAMRRMVPAMMKCEEIEYAGVAVSFNSERGLNEDAGCENPSSEDIISDVSVQKAQRFVDTFGGKIFEGYKNMLSSDAIDAVYIALPPSLHYRWAKQALENGKHVLMEKPFTTKLSDSEDLIKKARTGSLAVTENFAFCYHPQIAKIKEILESKVLGDIRIIRSNFAFPFRGDADFRYNKELGGGAVLDCGCYTLKLAEILLGEEAKITDHSLMYKEGYDVDMYGAVTVTGSKGEIAQLSFGMDQQYCCDLEIWGSKGCLRSPRIYTPPADLPIELTLTSGMDKTTITIEANDQFAASAKAFVRMINDSSFRQETYEGLIRQSERASSLLLYQSLPVKITYASAYFIDFAVCKSVIHRKSYQPFAFRRRIPVRSMKFSILHTRR